EPELFLTPFVSKRVFSPFHRDKVLSHSKTETGKNQLHYYVAYEQPDHAVVKLMEWATTAYDGLYTKLYVWADRLKEPLGNVPIIGSILNHIHPPDPKVSKD